MKPFAPDFCDTPASPGRPRFGYAPGGDISFPAVTIITPFFNTDEIFLETARSVMGQSLQQWEWLIVNDASDHAGSLRILDAFRGKDPRIRILDLDQNRGPSAGRNVGLKEARAPSVFFLDSDDLIEPTTLEKTAWCLESYPEFGFCKGLTVAFGAQEYLSPAGFDSARLFLFRNLVSDCCLVRRQVALSVGGFDQSLVRGLEDWEFWLRCASQGYWGHTIPEYLDWYRRRKSHSDRWAAWTPAGTRDMRRELRRRYPELYSGHFPPELPQALPPYSTVGDGIPFGNLLVKHNKRVLLLIPWMAMGGADKFNLDLVGQLQARGYHISIATTLPGNYPWYGEFARLTSDIFILPNFLRMNDYPRFLSYLIHSRQYDSVLISNSELAYRFLPYLRARCPDTTFLDICHMEEEYWNNGGHPRQATAYQDLLDLNVVSSQHLRAWMVGRGADASQIEVCYTNVDTGFLSPDPDLRSRVRTELHIAPGTPVLLYAGRLCQQKQPKVFASVMAELRARRLEFVCLVAGDGPDRRWLAASLRLRRLTRQVKMLGAVSSQRIRELLAASDILFLPSHMEGIAVTLFEAMSMEVVPVGADVGGQSELVTPDCGVLIQPGTMDQQVVAYADALEQLLRSQELRRSQAQAARKRVCSRFRIEQMGDRMAALLAQAGQFHQIRPKAIPGPRLGTEHAVQAIEHERVLKAAGPLWKYLLLEAIGGHFKALITPWASGLRRLLGPVAPFHALSTWRKKRSGRQSPS